MSDRGSRIRICYLAFVIGLLSATCVSSASASDKLYWGNYDGSTISSTNLDGSGGGSDLFTNSAPRGAAVNLPSGLTLDPATDAVYWANYAPGSISRGSLGGCDASSVCAKTLYPLGSGGPTVDSPSGLVVDPAHNGIFWEGIVSGTDGGIQRANLDGTGNGTTVNIAGTTALSSMAASGGLVIDSQSNRVYWTNFMWGAISFASLSGSGGGNVDVHLANNDGPYGLAIDKTTNKVYWATQNGLSGGHGSISWAYLDGSAGGDLYAADSPGCSAIDHPNGIAIDPGSNRVYWGNYGSSTIMRASLDGSGGCTTLSTAGATANGPDVVALLKKPVADSAPSVSGSGAVGGSLTCSEGTWADNVAEAGLFRAPRSLSYQWAVDGANVNGATNSSYTPPVAGTYACTVTATNAAGETSQTSSSITVTAAAGATTSSATTTTTTSTATTSRLAPVIKVKRPGVADCVRVSSSKAKFSISYVLTEQASVKGTLQRVPRSAATVGSCKKSQRTSGGKRFSTVRKISATGVAGKNRLQIKMTSDGKMLAPGRYRVRLQATNGLGVDSSVSAANFLLVVRSRK